jgi:hypothetical protein
VAEGADVDEALMEAEAGGGNEWMGFCLLFKIPQKVLHETMTIENRLLMDSLLGSSHKNFDLILKDTNGTVPDILESPHTGPIWGRVSTRTAVCITVSK